MSDAVMAHSKYVDCLHRTSENVYMLLYLWDWGMLEKTLKLTMVSIISYNLVVIGFTVIYNTMINCVESSYTVWMRSHINLFVSFH